MNQQLQYLLGDPTTFLQKIISTLTKEGIQVDDLELDHLCYRVETQERYLDLKKGLSQIGTLLSEKKIGGRPIATFELTYPIEFRERRIYLLELPAPKSDSFYSEGFEHGEFVIKESFEKFMNRYAHLSFDTKGMNKEVNPEIRLKFPDFNVKFHHYNLAYVIRYLD